LAFAVCDVDEAPAVVVAAPNKGLGAVAGCKPPPKPNGLKMEADANPDEESALPFFIG
jgi:hypothetical protein